jgi:alanine transaminase
MSTSQPRRALNIDNINPHVKEAQYAVRGELAVRSEEYRAKLAKGEGKDLPFDTVIAANIGNPQQLDQKPITFFRQVASLLENPILLESEDVLINNLGYKSDVIARAKWLLKEVKSVGAYSQSQGAPAIRESVAKYIERMSQVYTVVVLADPNQDVMVTPRAPKTSTSAMEHPPA